MPELVVVVPSRGRPYAVAELAEAFRETCTADTYLLAVFDESDPAAGGYREQAKTGPLATMIGDGAAACLCSAVSRSMVDALNVGAMGVLGWMQPPTAIGFMGDDHRPRAGRIGVIDAHRGWDQRYLDTLTGRPGIVYGNDLLQGINLPTQCAMSASWVRALGHMAPSALKHMYVDNYWLTLGRAAGCITYLPDVVVEHVHPVAGKAEWDDGYRRVNAPGMYARDKAMFETYWREHGQRDVDAVLGAAVAR